jgi:hypothetical protein
MKVLKTVLLCALAQICSASSFADTPIQQIPIPAGGTLIEQLMDGRLVQFTCASQGSNPGQNQRTECSAVMTIQLPGYIGEQPTQNVSIVGDSAISKLDAIQTLRKNCVDTMNAMSVNGGAQACAGLRDGVEITCKAL